MEGDSQKAKYIQGETVGFVKHKLTDSPAQNQTHILERKENSSQQWYKKGFPEKICGYKQTPMCSFPIIFDLCNDKDITVHESY